MLYMLNAHTQVLFVYTVHTAHTAIHIYTHVQACIHAYNAREGEKKNLYTRRLKIIQLSFFFFFTIHTFLYCKSIGSSELDST